MTNTLRIARIACGLSLREAALVLAVRPDSIQRAEAGRSPTPPGWLRELSALHQRQRVAAANAVDLILSKIADAQEGAIVDYGIPVDDVDAQGQGWPCVGAAEAICALIWGALADSGIDLRVVPRGSSPMTGGGC